MDISEIRRQNLRVLMKRDGAGKLSEQLGYRQSSFLSQMAGPNPTRDITEKTARAYEKQLGLSPGDLDKPMVGVEVQPTGSAEDMIALVLKATRTVGTVCEAEGVTLPTHKFASLLVLVLKDAADHGGTVDEDRVKDMVELAK